MARDEVNGVGVVEGREAGRQVAVGRRGRPRQSAPVATQRAEPVGRGSGGEERRGGGLGGGEAFRGREQEQGGWWAPSGGGGHVRQPLARLRLRRPRYPRQVQPRPLLARGRESARRREPARARRDRRRDHRGPAQRAEADRGDPWGAWRRECDGPCSTLRFRGHARRQASFRPQASGGSHMTTGTTNGSSHRCMNGYTPLVTGAIRKTRR